jgi:cytoskeletal protein RodZ
VFSGIIFVFIAVAVAFLHFCYTLCVKFIALAPNINVYAVSIVVQKTDLQRLCHYLQNTPALMCRDASLSDTAVSIATASEATASTSTSTSSTATAPAETAATFTANAARDYVVITSGLFPLSLQDFRGRIAAQGMLQNRVHVHNWLRMFTFLGAFLGQVNLVCLLGI